MIKKVKDVVKTQQNEKKILAGPPVGTAGRSNSLVSDFKTLTEISQDIANGGKMPVGHFCPTDKKELKAQEKRTKQLCKELFE